MSGPDVEPSASSGALSPASPQGREGEVTDMYTSVWGTCDAVERHPDTTQLGRVGGHGYGPMTPQKGSTAFVHSPGRH